MLGGSSALVSLTFSIATVTKAKTIRAQKKGKACSPFHAFEQMRIAAMASSR